MTIQAPQLALSPQTPPVALHTYSSTAPSASKPISLILLQAAGLQFQGELCFVIAELLANQQLKPDLIPQTKAWGTNAICFNLLFAYIFDNEHGELGALQSAISPG